MGGGGQVMDGGGQVLAGGGQALGTVRSSLCRQLWGRCKSIVKDAIQTEEDCFVS